MSQEQGIMYTALVDQTRLKFNVSLDCVEKATFVLKINLLDHLITSKHFVSN